MKKLRLDFIEFTKNKNLFQKIGIIFFNPNFKAVKLFRLSNFFYRHHLKVLAKICWYINRRKYMVDIDYRADLAGGFVLVHGLVCVIGKSVRSLGKLKIYQGVTIGGTGKIRDINGKKIGMPILGDNIVCGCNSSILGPVIIKDNFFVKAHSLVIKDVE